MSNLTDPADLQLSGYDFELPETLIAQTPAERREISRLLVYQRQNQSIQHSRFDQLGNWLQAGDLLVLNDTRVFPARLFGHKTHTGTRFEFLLAHPENPTGQTPNHWLAIAKNSKRIRLGYQFDFNEGVSALIHETREGGQVVLDFQNLPTDGFWPWIERQGEIPYPPYISSRESEPERYQTVYSREKGSVAAPTAGLHFTPELLQSLQAQGIDHVTLTLHVGLGTFTPVRSERIDEHQLHAELYHLPAASAERLNAQREAGRRIIAVGTTATRTLETVYRRFEGHFEAAEGATSLYLYPGQPLNAIDGLITNFHLPRSSLLMLVATWIGRQELLKLYTTAIRDQYRFYSFGDAMLLL